MLNGVLRVATLAVASAACAGADDAGDAAPLESGTAAAAVVPARGAGVPCVDAGVVPEREARGEALPPYSSCSVQLTRRGDPLTIEYAIR